MTHQITVQISRRAYGGLVAAANEAGKSPQQMALDLLEEIGLNLVGSLTTAQFIDRLTPQEYATIKEVAQSNAQVEELKNRLLERERIALDEEPLVEGLLALAAAGLLQTGRPAELVDFVIPEPLHNQS
jgi:hypothetical protein